MIICDIHVFKCIRKVLKPVETVVFLLNLYKHWLHQTALAGQIPVKGF